MSREKQPARAGEQEARKPPRAIPDQIRQVDEAELKARAELERKVAFLGGDGMKLGEVPEAERDYELCTAALGLNGMALQFVAEGARDMYLCQKAVRTTGMALQFVPLHLRSRTVCLKALRRDGLALCHVPQELRDRDVCLTALAQNSAALQYVPQELQDADMCRAALRVDGRALEFVPAALLDADMCFEAVRTSGMALRFVPEALRTPLIVTRALFSASADVRRRTDIVYETPPDWDEIRKNRPRDEWQRFESWSVHEPEDFPFPEELALPAGEVGGYLLELAASFAEAAGAPDFADRGESLVPGHSFWLEVGDGEERRRRIYAPALLALTRGERDGHGIPVQAGAFTAAACLMDWAAGWIETR